MGCGCKAGGDCGCGGSRRAAGESALGFGALSNSGSGVTGPVILRRGPSILLREHFGLPRATRVIATSRNEALPGSSVWSNMRLPMGEGRWSSESWLHKSDGVLHDKCADVECGGCRNRALGPVGFFTTIPGRNGVPVVAIEFEIYTAAHRQWLGKPANDPVASGGDCDWGESCWACKEVSPCLVKGWIRVKNYMGAPAVGAGKNSNDVTVTVGSGSHNVVKQNVSPTGKGERAKIPFNAQLHCGERLLARVKLPPPLALAEVHSILECTNCESDEMV